MNPESYGEFSPEAKVLLMNDNVKTDSIFNELSLSFLLDSVLRRRQPAFLAFLSVILVGLLYLTRATPIYEATATIEIDFQSAQVLSQVEEVSRFVSNDYFTMSAYMETQYAIIKSRDILERVVEKERLSGDLEFLRLDPNQDAETLMQKLEDVDPIKKLDNWLTVSPINKTKLVNLSFRHTKPEVAQRIANAVTDVYIERNLDRKLSSTHDAISWLQGQLAELRQKLDSATRTLYEFKRDNDILSASLENKASITAARIDRLSNEATTQRINVIRLEAKAQKLASLNPDTDIEGALIPEIMEQLNIRSVADKLGAMQIELSQLSERYTERHPKIEELRASLDRARGILTAQIRSYQAGLNMQLKEARQVLDLLDGQLEQAKSEALALSLKESEFSRIQREQETHQKLYDLVFTRLKETSLTGMLRTNNLQVVDYAVVPTVPVSPKIFPAATVTLILALMATVAVAAAVELSDNTIKGVDDIEKRIGVPLLGILPLVEPKKSEDGSTKTTGVDLYVTIEPKSAFAEEARSVRTNLGFILHDKHPLRILISSSLPSEGKTSVCCNLALLTAAAGKRTVVIDCDLRRPRLHKAFGRTKSPQGLSTLLAGQSKLEEIILHGVAENLDLIPCGPIPPNPAELLNMERFGAFVEELSAIYDAIIFDSPPMITVSDALAISRSADGVLLVAKAGETTRGALQRAVKITQDAGRRVLGVVVNSLDLNSKKYGYHYYQYYQYRYGKSYKYGKYGYKYGSKDGSKYGYGGYYEHKPEDEAGEKKDGDGGDAKTDALS